MILLKLQPSATRMKITDHAAAGEGREPTQNGYGYAHILSLRWHYAEDITTTMKLYTSGPKEISVAVTKTATEFKLQM